MTAIRPLCVECDSPIADDTAFYINGDVICKGCLNDNFKVKASDECPDEEDDE